RPLTSRFGPTERWPRISVLTSDRQAISPGRVGAAHRCRVVAPAPAMWVAGVWAVAVGSHTAPASKPAAAAVNSDLGRTVASGVSGNRSNVNLSDCLTVFFPRIPLVPQTGSQEDHLGDRPAHGRWLRAGVSVALAPAWPGDMVIVFSSVA